MDWLRQNKLNLSIAEGEYIFLGNSKQLSKISEIGNINIDKIETKRVDKAKYLGLAINESLSLKQKYKLVTGKMKGGLNSITLEKCYNNRNCFLSIKH